MSGSTSAPAQPGAVILVDLNHLGFRAQLGGSRLSSGDLETTGIYGFVRMLRVLRGEFRGRIICLHDGKSWRHGAFDGYKAKRRSDPKMAEAKERWVASRPYVSKALRCLNVDQMIASNLEADDLAARLRKRFTAAGREVVLVTSDRDWLQLLAPGVSLLDKLNDRLFLFDRFQEQVGLPTPKALAECKALMGDSSDNIPGVGAIGEKTAHAILNTYGSVNGFTNAMLGDPEARKTADKRALKLLDDHEKQDIFARNMRLIWLDHPDSPAAVKPNLVKGSFEPDKFRHLCEELAFHSILKDFDLWVKPFEKE